MMEIPLTEPLSADEEALCSRLVRHSTHDGKLLITTGGQVKDNVQFMYNKKHVHYYSIENPYIIDTDISPHSGSSSTIPGGI